MAFKNLFLPNVASGTDFLGTTAGFSKNKGTEEITSSSDWSYIGKKSLRVACPGSLSTEGFIINLSPVLPSTQIVLSEYIHTVSNIIVTAVVSEYGTSGWIKNNFFGNTQINNETKRIQLSIVTGSTTNRITSTIYLASQIATILYNDAFQLEPGSTATSYEFPGIDLTGNSIQAQEAVQNLKLNQQLKLFTIASEEQVQNLTVENILQLLQVPSSEYVNNLEICNSIFLEAIESTETVNELIAWVACEFMKCNITMKTPKTILKMKYPR